MKIKLSGNNVSRETLFKVIDVMFHVKHSVRVRLVWYNKNNVKNDNGSNERMIMLLYSRFIMVIYIWEELYL